MKSACIRISSNLFYLIKGITIGWNPLWSHEMHIEMTITLLILITRKEFVNYIRSTIPTGHRSSRTKYVFDNIQKESQGERFVSRRNLATQSNSIIGSPWNIGDTFNPPLPGPVVMYATGLQPPPLSQQMSILSAVTFSKTWNEYHECTSTPRR